MTKKRFITYETALNEALHQEMARDKKVFVYGRQTVNTKIYKGPDFPSNIFEFFLRGVKKCLKYQDHWML